MAECRLISGQYRGVNGYRTEHSSNRLLVTDSQHNTALCRVTTATSVRFLMSQIITPLKQIGFAEKRVERAVYFDMVGLRTAAKGYFRQECKALHFDCNPTLLVSRILHHPYHSPVAANPLLSPPVISDGNIITNWIGESCMISKSQKKKTPPALMSLVAHFCSVPSCGLTVTGNSIGNRFERRRSVSGVVILSSPKRAFQRAGIIARKG